MENGKRKFFLIITAALALALIPFNAGAQLFTGLSFDVNWKNSGIRESRESNSTMTSSYGGTISPQLGYIFNTKLMAGARLNLNFDKSYYNLEDDSNKYVKSSIGWDIAPFCRYKLMEFGQDGWFSVWADLHAYYGTMYPRRVDEEGYIYKIFNKKFNYGIQAMPALGFRLNESTTIFVNVAILSLGYSGSATKYDNKTEYDNQLVLFTGKLSGLFTAIATEGLYGIKFGIVRTL